ncbi:hypothetical protein [Haloglomus litoreum]|nr:hypothetical protein [Haloglomus sp. DT116]
MAETRYVDTRTTHTARPRPWKYWFLLGALALGPLYVLLLPVLVG